MSIAAPNWVITPYHWPACWTSSRTRWSASTNSSDVTAISSHKNMKVPTADAVGTSSRVVTKRGSTHDAGAAGESVAAVAEAKDHGAQPDARRDGDEQRPERIETKGEAEQRKQSAGVHRRSVAGGEYVGGQRRSRICRRPRVRATDKRTRTRGGALAPATEAARPSRAVATKRSVLTSPTGPASAVMMASGSGGQPGISTSTGTTSATAPGHAVGAAEDPAVAGAVPHRHHQRGFGHRLVGLAQRVGHVVRDRARHEQSVGVAWGGLEADAETLRVVGRGEA